jgi:hypothetical protein
MSSGGRGRRFESSLPDHLIAHDDCGASALNKCPSAHKSSLPPFAPQPSLA